VYAPTNLQMDEDDWYFEKYSRIPLSTHSYPEYDGEPTTPSSSKEGVLLLVEGRAEDALARSEWILVADLSDKEDEDIPS